MTTPDAETFRAIVEDELQIAERTGHGSVTALNRVVDRWREACSAPDHDTPSTDDPCICSAHQRHSDCGRDAYPCPCYRAKLAAAVTRAEQAEAVLPTEAQILKVGEWLMEHRGWDTADVDELSEGFKAWRALVSDQPEATP